MQVNAPFPHILRHLGSALEIESAPQYISSLSCYYTYLSAVNAICQLLNDIIRESGTLPRERVVLSVYKVHICPHAIKDACELH